MSPRITGLPDQEREDGRITHEDLATSRTEPAWPSVLIVEDSAPQALKLKLGLESEGCRVYWAETGYDGLAAARQERFDLIVLDIELPDITGFEVCRALKLDAALVDIPVVILTTRDHAEDVLNGLEIGAIDYIPKDAFAEAVLLETIRQMKQQRQQT